MSILILAAGYGEGHRQAAAALAHVFKERRDPVRVDVVDYMEMVHPVANSVTQSLYKNGVKKAPKLYGMFYRQTDKIRPSSSLHQLVRQIGARKLLKYIKSTEPSVVINTFPLSAGALSWLREHELTNVPTATVITDYTVHSQWVHRHTDHYFVGAEHVKETLLHKGVHPAKIHVTGIPIRRCFHEHYDRHRLKQTLGLDNRPIVLIMGGWHGVFDAQLCEQLVEAGEHTQLLFVCGGDRQLFHRILPLQMKFPDRVRVFGYVSNIPELMTVSDFVLTKAGGLTTSEALAMGLPMLLYRPIPGQEEENARFLIAEGVACLARDQQQLLEQFVHLSRHRRKLVAMKKRASYIREGNAASAICDTILQYITEPELEQFHAVTNLKF